MRYPSTGSGKRTYYDYGTSDGLNDTISRLESIQDNSGYDLAEYACNGLSRLVKDIYKTGAGGSEVVRLDYTGSTAGSYTGFDYLGRITDQKWVRSSTVKDQYGYAYDDNSNRTYRDNTQTTGKDWHFASHDDLNRLKGVYRGTFTGSPPTFDGNRNFSQGWTLDDLGNWSAFSWDPDGDGGTSNIIQSRLHNLVNEIDTNDDHSDSPGASISGTNADWVDPAYDRQGNMTFTPRVGFETTAA